MKGHKSGKMIKDLEVSLIMLIFAPTYSFINSLNRMLMEHKKAKNCEKSVQKFGSVVLFTYFCR